MNGPSIELHIKEILSMEFRPSIETASAWPLSGS